MVTSLSEEELKTVQARTKLKESDSIEFSTPVIGVLALMDWHYEAVSIVAAASECAEHLLVLNAFESVEHRLLRRIHGSEVATSQCTRLQPVQPLHASSGKGMIRT